MVDKTYSLAVRYAQLGQECENVLHFRKQTAGDPSGAQWLTIANAWKEVIRDSMSTTVLFVDWVATQVLGAGVTYSTTTCRQVGGTIQLGALTGTLAGAATGDALPPACAATLSLGTGVRGRSFRSHLQLGGFVEAQQVGGGWIAGFNSTIQPKVDTFRGVYGSGGSDADFDWCTFSRGIASGCFPDPNLRHHPLVHRQAGDVENAIASVTSAVLGTLVTSMRSRFK